MPHITMPQPHPRRVSDPNGTVHAARNTGDRRHFTTACADYPAPKKNELEATPDRTEVTCLTCDPPSNPLKKGSLYTHARNQHGMNHKNLKLRPVKFS